MAIRATPSAPVVAVAPVGCGDGATARGSVGTEVSSSTGMPATGALPSTAVRDTERVTTLISARGALSVKTGCGATLSDTSETSVRGALPNGSWPPTTRQPQSPVLS
jgi:hypothetical protein